MAMLRITPYGPETKTEMVMIRLARLYKRYNISQFVIAFCWELQRWKAKHPGTDNYRVLLTKPDQVQVWHCEGVLKNDRKLMEITVQYIV
jgi:hypothetical protein